MQTCMHAYPRTHADTIWQGRPQYQCVNNHPWPIVNRLFKPPCPLFCCALLAGSSSPNWILSSGHPTLINKDTGSAAYWAQKRQRKTFSLKDQTFNVNKHRNEPRKWKTSQPTRQPLQSCPVYVMCASVELTLWAWMQKNLLACYVLIEQLTLRVPADLYDRCLFSLTEVNPTAGVMKDSMMKMIISSVGSAAESSAHP